MTIDLHTHTSYSDGTDGIDQWFAAARAAGVGTLGLTDHDTTGGWAAAAEARPAGMALVRGAELSTHVVMGSRRYSIHLLAYLFDPAEPSLAAELARLKRDRLQRALTMVDRMAADGLPIDRADVLRIADGAPVGRPHIGRALVTAGLVRSVTEAFGTYLSARGPYFVAKADTELVAAIGLVRRAGGVSVMAHPRARGAAAITDEALLARCADAGLAGVEVDHPDHDRAARDELASLARNLGLIVTGASDYHGANKALVMGQESTDPDVLSALAAASSGVTPILGPGR